MSKNKLNITFHNPNTEDKMAKAIAKMLVKSVVEQAMIDLNSTNVENTVLEKMSS